MPSPPFLHTASDQKLDSWKAWERGYIFHVLGLSASQNVVSEPDPSVEVYTMQAHFDC